MATRKINRSGKNLYVNKVFETGGTSSTKIQQIKSLISSATTSKKIDSIISSIQDIASDDVISPSEKSTLKKLWASLQTTYYKVVSQVSDSDSAKKSAYYSLMVSTFTTLNSYMEAILADMSTSYSGNAVAVLDTLFENCWTYMNGVLTVYENSLSFSQKYTLRIVGTTSFNGSTDLEARVYDTSGAWLSEYIELEEYEWYKQGSPATLIEEGNNTYKITVPDTIFDDYEEGQEIYVTWTHQVTENGSTVTYKISAFATLTIAEIAQYSYQAAAIESALNKDSSAWYDTEPTATTTGVYLWVRTSSDNGNTWTYYRRTGDKGDSGDSFSWNLLNGTKDFSGTINAYGATVLDDKYNGFTVWRFTGAANDVFGLALMESNGIEYESGSDYTFSFYAKGTASIGLQIGCKYDMSVDDGDLIENISEMESVKTFAISEEWTRYKVHLKVGENVYSELQTSILALMLYGQDGLYADICALKYEHGDVENPTWTMSEADAKGADGDGVTVQYTYWNSVEDEPDDTATWYSASDLPAASGDSVYLWIRTKTGDGDWVVFCQQQKSVSFSAEVLPTSYSLNDRGVLSDSAGITLTLKLIWEGIEPADMPATIAVSPSPDDEDSYITGDTGETTTSEHVYTLARGFASDSIVFTVSTSLFEDRVITVQNSNAGATATGKNLGITMTNPTSITQAEDGWSTSEGPYVVGDYYIYEYTGDDGRTYAETYVWQGTSFVKLSSSMEDYATTAWGALGTVLQTNAVINSESVLTEFVGLLIAQDAAIQSLQSQYIKILKAIYGGAYNKEGNLTEGDNLYGFHINKYGYAQFYKALLRDVSLTSLDGTLTLLETSKKQEIGTIAATASAERWDMAEALAYATTEDSRQSAYYADATYNGMDGRLFNITKGLVIYGHDNLVYNGSGSFYVYFDMSITIKIVSQNGSNGINSATVTSAKQGTLYSVSSSTIADSYTVSVAAGDTITFSYSRAALRASRFYIVGNMTGAIFVTRSISSSGLSTAWRYTPVVAFSATGYYSSSYNLVLDDGWSSSSNLNKYTLGAYYSAFVEKMSNGTVINLDESVSYITISGTQYTAVSATRQGTTIYVKYRDGTTLKEESFSISPAEAEGGTAGWLSKTLSMNLSLLSSVQGVKTYTLIPTGSDADIGTVDDYYRNAYITDLIAKAMQISGDASVTGTLSCGSFSCDDDNFDLSSKVSSTDEIGDGSCYKIKFKNGLLIQWGYIPAKSDGNGVTINFLEAYTSADGYALVGGLIPGTASRTYEHMNFSNLTTTSFYFYSYDGYACRWAAIGF